jgi:hypothetical protein
MKEPKNNNIEDNNFENEELRKQQEHQELIRKMKEEFLKKQNLIKQLQDFVFLEILLSFF